jgi:pimeloyl-ACP methyl ester carboxylesterase
MTLPDQRQLGYQLMGDPDGFAVLVLHGTPGSSRQIAVLSAAASERGLALVAPDRAGYGRSTFDPARTIASGARDLGELMAHLELTSFVVIGISGGGPTALACGALLADKVTAVATIGGVGPLVPRDPSLPPDRLVIRIARRSEPVTRALFSAIGRAGRSRPARTLDRLAAQMAEPDAGLLRTNESLRAAMLDDISHPSPTGAAAAARDFRLFARKWDIDLSAITVPVHVWHGTADRNVPVAHGHVIANRCPAGELHVVDGGGHLLLDQLDEILASVRP